MYLKRKIDEYLLEWKMKTSVNYKRCKADRKKGIYTKVPYMKIL